MQGLGLGRLRLSVDVSGSFWCICLAFAVIITGANLLVLSFLER